MKVVIDTSILIDHLRGGDIWEHFLANAEHTLELFLPTIVIFELFSGKSTSDPTVAEKIQNLLSYFQKIDLTEKIAKRAGELYRDITKNIDVPDYVVAATGLEIGASVLTLNRKHFEQIPSLHLYQL